MERANLCLEKDRHFFDLEQEGAVIYREDQPATFGSDFASGGVT